MLQKTKKFFLFVLYTKVTLLYLIDFQIIGKIFQKIYDVTSF